MTDTRKAKLIGKVKATNAAHQAALDLYPKLRAVFEPFVGQKVLTATGTLLAKIDKLMPELPNNRSLIVYRNSSDYSISFGVRANAQVDDHSCIYGEITLYVGDLTGGVLTKLYDPPTFRADFTVEEIEQKRADFKVKKKAADDAASALHPFAVDHDN